MAGNRLEGPASMKSRKSATRGAYLALLGILLVQASASAQQDDDEGYDRLLALAEARTQAEDWQSAAQLWPRVVEANPHVAAYWYWLGTAHLNLADYREAIPALEKALSLGAGRPYNIAYQIAKTLTTSAIAASGPIRTRRSVWNANQQIANINSGIITAPSTKCPATIRFAGGLSIIRYAANSPTSHTDCTIWCQRRMVFGSREPVRRILANKSVHIRPLAAATTTNVENNVQNAPTRNSHFDHAPYDSV